MPAPTSTELLLELERYPGRLAAGANLFELLEHMIGGQVSVHTLRRDPGQPAYPRVLVALLCLEGVEALVKAEPPLPRAEREAITTATLALAQELLLPSLPDSLAEQPARSAGRVLRNLVLAVGIFALGFSAEM